MEKIMVGSHVEMITKGNRRFPSASLRIAVAGWADREGIDRPTVEAPQEAQEDRKAAFEWVRRWEWLAEMRRADIRADRALVAAMARYPDASPEDMATVAVWTEKSYANKSHDQRERDGLRRLARLFPSAVA